MRTLELSDILSKKFKVEDGKVIEAENGDYFNRKVAEFFASDIDDIEKLETDRLKDLDNEEYEKYVLDYCNISAEKLLSEEKNGDWNVRPTKEYELFKLNSKEPQIMLLKAESLPTGRKRDLYYDLDIANKVFKNYQNIEQNILYPTESNEEVIKINRENDELRREDDELFEKDEKIYDILSDTSFLTNYNYLNSQNEKLMEENKNLKENLTDTNKKIIELTISLDNAMETIEDLSRPKSFKEKFFDLFNLNKIKFLK